MKKGKSNKPIERIHVSKNDEIALIVERIIDANADEVILTIPRFSRLAESAANFHLIKREADLLKKSIVIESVDDKVIKLAQDVKIQSLNPILVKRKQFSDIISTPRPAATEKDAAAKKTTAEEPLPEIDEEKPISSEGKKPRKKRKKIAIRFRRRASGPKPAGRKLKLPKKRWIITSVIGVVVIIILAGIFQALPKVDIKIVTEKMPWKFEDTITLKKSEGTTQVFHDSRNLNMSFTASGMDKIEEKAHGTITVYNAYSSKAQPLVRRTRFVTPDGKIFRLTKGITVPAAKVVEGKIIPSSIDAAVIADEPGSEYNIGPVSRYSIPGFKGTAKYEGFYGQSDKPMSGGSLGEVSVPTDGDVRAAKESTSARIEQVLATSLLGSLPEDFVIIDGAKEFQVTKQNVISKVDSQGNFNVFTEAEMDVVGFKEADVVETIATKMKEDLGGDYEFKNFSINYGKADTDFDSGVITFPVKFSGIAYRPIDIKALKERVVGLAEKDLQVAISSLPGFKSGQVSFWPFWVKTVPSRLNRVRIDIL